MKALCRFCEETMPVVGRVLMGVFFFMGGVGKLMGGMDGFVAMVGGIGLPAPLFLAWAVVTLEIVGGALLVIGLCTRKVAEVLAAFVLLTIVLVHNSFDDPGLFRNMAIIGGLLYMASFPAGRFSLDGKKKHQHKTPESPEGGTDEGVGIRIQ